MRTVMTGFGMLVGICWDKAFETAHETVAETVPTFRMHPVIGTASKSRFTRGFGIHMALKWLETELNVPFKPLRSS